jgi:hypothetical protein
MEEGQNEKVGLLDALSGVFLHSLFIITKVLTETEIIPFNSDLTPLISVLLNWSQYSTYVPDE